MAIGSGHMMRCLTLAEGLRDRQADVVFVCRELPGNLITLAEGKGFIVKRLPFIDRSNFLPENNHAGFLGVTLEQDVAETLALLRDMQPVGWLVVDHYAIDARWESQMRFLADRIMVLDDLADRPHDCDLLLDQNLYEDMDTRYDALLPEGCQKFLGPRYALLRPEFAKARASLRKRDGVVRRVLIFFGGSDPTNETAKALQAVIALNRPDIAVDVIVGATNPRRAEIEAKCALLPNVAYHCQVENMAELMASADLAIGAGGSTTWERCALGVPSITLITAENQRETTFAVANAGATWNMGVSKDVKVEDLIRTIDQLSRNILFVNKMGQNALKIVQNETSYNVYCNVGQSDDRG